MWIQAEDRDIGIEIWEEMSDELKNYYVYDFKNRENDIDNKLLEHIKGTIYYRTYVKSLVSRTLESGEINSVHEYEMAVGSNDEKFVKMLNKLKNKNLDIISKIVGRKVVESV